LPHVLLAALCHELGHLAVLGGFGICPERITLSAMGVEITARGQERLSYGRELLAVLAGAAVNIGLAVLFARVFGEYLFAGANAVLAVYNLLPIRNLDGGRALYLLLAWATNPFTAEYVSGIVHLVTLALLLGFGGVILVRTGGGLFLFAGSVGLCAGDFLRRRKRKSGLPNGGKPDTIN